MKTKVPEHVARWRANHHAALERIFPGRPGLATWRALRRIEGREHAREMFENLNRCRR